jgi:hypothetical protein
MPQTCPSTSEQQRNGRRVVTNRSHLVVPAGPRTLTTFLIHRNSRESRDSDNQMQKPLNRTKKRPESLEEAGQSASKTGSR